jgi:hypothetical protein
MLLEGRQALDFGIAQGRGSAGLSLTSEQYQKLKIWITKSDRFDSRGPHLANFGA